MHYLDERHILTFLIQISVILILVRIVGEFFRRIKQPSLTAELLIGVILGPTILGRFFPEFQLSLFPQELIQQNMLETVAWIGVLFLLLETGLEIDFSSAWRQKGSALIISVADIIIPMMIAFIPAWFLPDSYLVDPTQRLQFALFLAVVMTISAMPIASRVMSELKILKTDMGFLTMSALAVNDIIGWVLFTIILGIFTTDTSHSNNIFVVLGATLGFATLALTVGRRLSNKAVDFFQRKSIPEPASSFAFVCVLGVVFGAITQKLGIHALFGFFIAGIVAGEAKNLKEETRSIISQMVNTLFVPIFFVNIGLKLDFIANFDFLVVAMVSSFGIIARFIGAYVGASLSPVAKINRPLIAIAHTPGGMMEIVIALLALETGLITQKLFIAIVFSAVFSSIVMGPWMSYALSRRKKVKLIKYLQQREDLLVLDAEDKFQFLEKLVTQSAITYKGSDSKAIIAALHERERDYSTAVGENIAVPHFRSKNVLDPRLVVAYSERGVDWNAMDGKPVHYIFLLMSPANSKDIHIETLSKIVGLMQKKENRESLEHAHEGGNVLDALHLLLQQG